MGMFDKVKDNSIVKKASEIDEKVKDSSVIKKASELDEINKSRKEEKAERKRIEKERKQNIKDGEKILKNLMGTKMKGNAHFFAKMKAEGINATHQWPAWYKIHGQAKKEIKAGTLLPQDIPTRLDELLVENGNPEKKLEYQEKNQKRVEAALRQKEIQSISLGVEGYDFQCSLNEVRTNTFGNKKEDVATGFCFVKEDRLIIKKFSAIRKSPLGDKIIPYSNIKAIDYDKAHGLHVTNSIVIVIGGVAPVVLKHTLPQHFELLHNAWLNFNSKPNVSAPTVVESNQPSAADELLKWHDLYEKGVISEEEFEAKKKELL